ncbi:TVP38/TMEM64 family protein [Paenibacillus chitinolyticus]|uniref:TVP38/TMEM64 family protein n=1 Tax=Paenibacillus chitinolyticus TaxID=79263 RepID=UPI0035DABC0C
MASLKWLTFIRTKRFIYGMTIVLVIIAVLSILYRKSDWRHMGASMEQLTPWLISLGMLGKTLGIALVFLQTLFPFVPFVIIAGANVALFGIKWGFVVNYVMSVLSSVTAFIIARYFAHDWVERKLSSKPLVQQFNRKLEHHGFLYILMGRLIPVIPSSAISFGAGVTSVTFRQFVLGTTIGKIPMVLLESLIAHDLFHFKAYKGRLFVLLAIFVILMVLGSLFKKRLDARKQDKPSS